MRLRKVIVALTPEQAQEVLRIELDNDAEGALKFLRKILSKRVKEALQTR